MPVIKIGVVDLMVRPCRVDSDIYYSSFTRWKVIAWWKIIWSLCRLEGIES